MNRKTIGGGVLVAALLCLGTVRAEDMPAPYTGAAGSPFAPPPAGGPAPIGPAPILAAGPAAPIMTQPSNWMDYPRCLGCCGPVGRNGPIGYEIYVRNGFDFPLGGNPFGARMDAGWDVEAGARTLFFNTASDAAWTVDLGVSNAYNSSRDRNSVYRLFNLHDRTNNTTIPETDVTIRDLNRTYFNVAGGREVYLWGSANCDKPDVNWRAGVDVGGRYGTEKLDVTNFRHLTDVNAGVFLAIHSDLEIPWGCCILQAGLRSEYGYTWADILQRQNNSDVQDISLLFNLGVRF